jgi:uncharacterized protein (DUF433 family)
MLEQEMPHEHIEHRTGAGGVPMAYVGKSRVRVSTIAATYQSLIDELMVDKIQEGYPTLSKEEIWAAIEYWREHPDEIAEELAEDMRIIESLKSPG